MNSTRIFVTIGAVLLALGGVWLLYSWQRPPAGSGAAPGQAATALQQGAPTAPSERQPLYWYDPMVPAQRFAKPGKSPFMDMQLVPKYADGAGNGAPSGGGIAINPRMVQNLGVRFATVALGSFAQVVDTVGMVAADEHRIVVVQVRAPGWVEQLDVRAVGDPVRRGQRLAAVYSPDLLATQQELLLARDAGDAALVAAARDRLVLSGVSAPQIARLQETGIAQRRIDYSAPFDGYVMALGVRQGAAVQADTVLFQLADLRTVWLTAEVPEVQAAWVRPGDAVVAQVAALPGVRFTGRVDYLYPELVNATRTLQVRVVLANEGNRLRPGMFATLQLRGAPRTAVLSVPTEAVIRTGTRSVVIVAPDAAHFRPVLVQVGAEHDDTSEIISGLKQGERVVASGQFLIDAEANLRSALDNLSGDETAADAQSGAAAMPLQQAPGGTAPTEPAR